MFKVLMRDDKTLNLFQQERTGVGEDRVEYIQFLIPKIYDLQRYSLYLDICNQK